MHCILSGIASCNCIGVLYHVVRSDTGIPIAIGIVRGRGLREATEKQNYGHDANLSKCSLAVRCGCKFCSGLIVSLAYSCGSMSNHSLESGISVGDAIRAAAFRIDVVGVELSLPLLTAQLAASYRLREQPWSSCRERSQGCRARKRCGGYSDPAVCVMTDGRGQERVWAG
jgi:hypothetical protein